MKMKRGRATVLAAVAFAAAGGCAADGGVTCARRPADRVRAPASMKSEERMNVTFESWVVQW